MSIIYLLFFSFFILLPVIAFVYRKSQYIRDQEEIYSFSYRSRDIQYLRLESLENLAKDDNLKITPQILFGLGKIAREDRDKCVRDLAKSLLDSYTSKGDFSDTQPYIEKKAEEARLCLEIKSNLEYDPKDIWYDRLKSLERLSETKFCDASNELIKDLFNILNGDDDWRIRALAYQMLVSYSERGDFSDTYPYKQKRAEEKRLTLSITSIRGYNVQDIWYDRLKSLENLANAKLKNVSSEMLDDLKKIAQDDDDWRIRALATEIYNNHSEKKFVDYVRA